MTMMEKQPVLRAHGSASREIGPVVTDTLMRTTEACCLPTYFLRFFFSLPVQLSFRAKSLNIQLKKEKQNFQILVFIPQSSGEVALDPFDLNDSSKTARQPSIITGLKIRSFSDEGAVQQPCMKLQWIEHLAHRSQPVPKTHLHRWVQTQGISEGRTSSWLGISDVLETSVMSMAKCFQKCPCMYGATRKKWQIDSSRFWGIHQVGDNEGGTVYKFPIWLVEFVNTLYHLHFRSSTLT